MLYGYIICCLLMAVAAVISVRKNKLTPLAGIIGFLTGLVIFAGSGTEGVAMLAMFFLLGTASTAVGKDIKLTEGLANDKDGRRTAGQVLANAGVAALLGLSGLLFPAYENIWLVMTAGSFSSAAADTMSSELGNVYGSKYFNIITFKKDKRGRDGVVSIEGTLCGIAGSMMVGLVYAAFMGFDMLFFVILIAGTIGNLIDSLLGVAAERKGWLTNDYVNLFNTIAGAIAAYILSCYQGYF